MTKKKGGKEEFWVRLQGYIMTYSEQGIGLQFLFIEDGKRWPECAHELKEGNHLKIYTGKEIVSRCIFDGILECGGQNYHYHAIPKGWRMIDWYRFFSSGWPYLRAELVKKSK